MYHVACSIGTGGTITDAAHIAKYNIPTIPNNIRIEKHHASCSLTAARGRRLAPPVNSEDFPWFEAAAAVPAGTTGGALLRTATTTAHSGESWKQKKDRREYGKSALAPLHNDNRAACLSDVQAVCEQNGNSGCHHSQQNVLVRSTRSQH